MGDFSLTEAKSDVLGVGPHKNAEVEPMNRDCGRVESHPPTEAKTDAPEVARATTPR